MTLKQNILKKEKFCSGITNLETGEVYWVWSGFPISLCDATNLFSRRKGWGDQIGLGLLSRRVEVQGDEILFHTKLDHLKEVIMFPSAKKNNNNEWFT